MVEQVHKKNVIIGDDEYKVYKWLAAAFAALSRTQDSTSADNSIKFKYYLNKATKHYTPKNEKSDHHLAYMEGKLFCMVIFFFFYSVCL